MTVRFEWADEVDRRLALSATGRLAELNRAGVLEATDIHVAERTSALAEAGAASDPDVLLAVALAVRALRAGSVLVDLAEVPGQEPELHWPDPVGWAAAVAASPVGAAGVVRVEGTRVYLDRYHRLEQQVAYDLCARADEPLDVDAEALASALARVRGDHLSPEQEAAAVQALGRSLTVLTGGPGTGKTTTVARMLVLLADQARAAGRRASIVLAAPTGKAATRLAEAVAGELAGLEPADRDLVGRPAALTLHRLLGWRPDNATRFRHDRSNRLGHDVVVVDECSMVDLTLMGRLLEAVRPDARLILLGDPRQLTSVGAGAVLADVVAGFGDTPSSPVASLTENFRSTEQIKRLGAALLAAESDPEAVEHVLEELRSGGPGAEVEFVETDQPADAVREATLGVAEAVQQAALAGDPAGALGALDRHRLLCAHRDGPFGVRHWNRQVEQWLAEVTGVPIFGEWYVGRPVLVTHNDYALDVYNGEVGATIRGSDGRLRVWIAGSEGGPDGAHRDFAPGRLDAVETMHAMTIHKSQGSQAEEVTVLLPDDSRLLTRELLYTAVTRAKRRVRVVGTEAAVRAAVGRAADRASGLRARLAAAGG